MIKNYRLKKFKTGIDFELNEDLINDLNDGKPSID